MTPASHRRPSHAFGTLSHRDAASAESKAPDHHRIKTADDTNNRRTPAAPKNRLIRLSGSIDIVGAVRYQCPSNMPTTEPPKTAALANSDATAKSRGQADDTAGVPDFQIVSPMKMM